MSVSVESAVYARLAADAALLALTSQGADTGIYLEQAPQGRRQPLLIINHQREAPEAHIAGLADVADTEVQVHCFADAHSQALQLRALVRAQLASWQGLQAVGADSVWIGSAREQATEAGSIPQIDGGEQGLFAATITFRIRHSTT